MAPDIFVAFETTPRMTEAQVRQLFDKMGDEAYHRCVEDVKAGGGAGSGTSCAMFLTLDRRDGGRLEGMEVETDHFVRDALRKRDVEPRNITVEAAPE
jgi:hypothetical protein